MPTHVVRLAPDQPEYVLWSTVVDAPTSAVMSRDQVTEWLRQGRRVDADLAQEQARRDLARIDETGTSERKPSMGYGYDRFWWRENAPADIGTPYEDEDDPGRFLGRTLTRAELFEACRALA